MEAAGDKPVPSFLLGDFGFGGAGPEADAFGVEFCSDVNGATEEFEADLTAFAADEAGVMFASRVEEVAGAGFDDDAQVEFVEELAQASEVGRLGGEWVAVVVVEGKRNTAIAAVGHDFERFLQAVVRKTVGVVSKTKIHLALSFDK